MPKLFSSLTFSALATSLALAFPVHAASTLPVVQEAPLRAHLAFLSSDLLEGRGTGQRGADLTVSYLETQALLAGLKPVRGNSFRQSVQIAGVKSLPQESSLQAVAGDGKAVPLAFGPDWVWATGDSVAAHTFDAPLVFVGYGITAPEEGWNDFRNADVKGKIVVMMVNDPQPTEAEPNRFAGKALTYYGRWTYKFEEAARRGAEGVLIVHETAPAAYGWATVKSSGTSPLFDIERGQAEAMAQHTPLRGWMQRELAEAIFADAGLDFDAEKRKAMRADFRPVALDNAKLSVDFALKREQVVTRNVVAKLPGGEHADEAVIFSAHWDAFGIGQADAKGDRIRRGAIDNATGVATVLELGRVFAAGPQPQRTLYFVALTAEEKGLLGASYYAAHPLAPLDKTAAVLNIEMFSPDGATRDIASWGKGRVSLEGDLERVAKARGRSYSPDPNLEAGFFYRADHFAFARLGVPAITIGPGLDKLDGGVEAGRALREKYFADCYHQACDAWTPSWDPAGHAADTLLVYDLGAELANSRRWPTWEKESEFRGARDKSEAARR